MVAIEEQGELDRSAGYHQGRTIMVVDDDTGLLNLYGIILRRAGYQVVTAAGGAEAQRIVRSGLRPDLVIADLRMPRISGSEFATWYLAAHPSARITLISSDPFAAARLTEGCPAIRCTLKPFNAADVLSIAREALRTDTP